nr:rho GTPase-activating protein 20-like [Microcebus murinus]
MIPPAPVWRAGKRRSASAESRCLHAESFPCLNAAASARAPWESPRSLEDPHQKDAAVELGACPPPPRPPRSPQPRAKRRTRGFNAHGSRPRVRCRTSRILPHLPTAAPRFPAALRHFSRSGISRVPSSSPCGEFGLFSSSRKDPAASQPLPSAARSAARLLPAGGGAGLGRDPVPSALGPRSPRWPGRHCPSAGPAQRSSGPAASAPEGQPALTQKMKALVERRRSIPSLLPDKAVQEQPRTSTERPSAAMKTCAFLTAFACSSRTLLIDGLVELRTGVQRQERHIFLFDDMLVVAKSKHKNNLKMKYKIKLSDMWTASCVNEVGDGKGSAMKSFVLGWPTQNFVATFSSPELKDTWLTLLQRHIDLEKQKDHPKSIPLRIFIEDMGNCVHYKTIRVNNTDRTNEVIHKLLSVLGVTGCEGDYQLCISSGKETALYPLIGHEYPYGIKMKHLRDNAILTGGSRDPTTVFNSQEAFLLEELPGERQCQFILKPRFLAAAQQLRDSHWKTSEKRRCVINSACCWGSTTEQDNSLVSLPTSPPVAGELLGLSLENTSEKDTHEVVDAPCVNIGKTVGQGSTNMASILKFTDDILKQPEVEDVLNKNDCDLDHCNEEGAQIEHPLESKLFGVSLKTICKNGNLPKPIMDILLFLNEKGPLKEGIFFVPADMEYCQQLKEKLNCGVPVQLYWENAFVLASILMDFLKEIPGSILSSDLYDEWVGVMDNGEDKDKINKIQRLLEKLPRANVVLLNYLFALLYNIEKNSASNQMDSSNLAACVAPAILWPAPSCGPEPENELVMLLFQFMLEKCETVFGEEIKSLYGEFSGTYGTRGNTSGISDISRFELSDSSSVESLECELNEDVYAPFPDLAKDPGHWKTRIQSMLMDVENLEPAEVAYLLSLNDFLLEHPE